MKRGPPLRSFRKQSSGERPGAFFLCSAPCCPAMAGTAKAQHHQFSSGRFAQAALAPRLMHKNRHRDSHHWFSRRSAAARRRNLIA